MEASYFSAMARYISVRSIAKLHVSMMIAAVVVIAIVVAIIAVIVARKKGRIVQECGSGHNPIRTRVFETIVRIP